VILADTSVWIEHFRSPNRALGELLEQDQVLVHPFVIGEIACGHFRNRAEIISLMQAMPAAPRADDGEILLLTEQRRFRGRGIGLIDIHLLASCLMAPCLVWTADKRLKMVADELAVAFEPISTRD
jgi:predicted nucleic acid-binding protein